MRTLMLLANDNARIGDNERVTMNSGVVFDQYDFVPYRYDNALANLIIFLPLEK